MPYPRPVLRALAPMLAAAALAACDKPVAIGDANIVIVGAPDSVSAALQDEIAAALEPRIFTVRDERVFEASYISPTGSEWPELRHVRQVLVIGEPADPWIAQTLEELDGPAPTPPALVQARDVWAQNQQVTAIILPPGSRPEAAAPLVAAAGDSLVAQFERFTRSRMYVSRPDTAARDSLLAANGFALTVPRVYRVFSPAQELVVFRNDNPDPAKLIREIDVAWRPSGEVPFTADAALQWRQQITEQVTDPRQVLGEGETRSRELTVGGHRVLEVQGVWANPPGGWPAAGPFILHLVQCPERTYLLNAWLYAPGEPKYQYMVQLQTLLNSFQCTR